VKAQLITFEGIEGSGKSTQAALFHEWLSSRGTDAVLTREPGGTRLGEEVRRLLLHTTGVEIEPLAELFLYLACRAQIVNEVIRPALRTGRVVVVDRFFDSTVAYQGWGRNIDTATIDELNRVATGGLVPDLTFIIDVDPEEGFDRLRRGKTARPRDRIEAEEPAFHRRVRDGFRDLARREARCRLVDGGRSIGEIQDELRRCYASFGGT
jgi:dTMP kinase